MHVIATAGHVDHGKSTLVRALTGMEPDRWAQERRRGMTIDLGFAWTALPSGERLAFVDVPGHERFVPNMLAGVGPVPAALVVVAADEGWMPQTAEHVAALDALGVRHAVLAVTRADLADPRPVLRAVRDRLARTALARAAAVPVSAPTGQGLAELRAALDDLVAGLPAPDTEAPVRLWVDRSFAIRGSGTVVTGTLGAGTLRTGDTLTLYAAGRGERPVRIRGLQSLGRPADPVPAVARVAVNLRGIDPAAVRRGDALLTPSGWAASALIDARVDGDLAGVGSALVLHLGSAAVPVRVRPLGGAMARLTLARPVPVAAGDVALLRDPGRHQVVGRVTVLDTEPTPLVRRGAAAARARELAEAAQGPPDPAAVLRRHGVVRAATLRATGVPVPAVAVVAGDWLVDPKLAERLRVRLGEAVAEHRQGAPIEAGPTVESLRALLGVPDRAVVSVLVAPPLAIRDGRVVDVTAAPRLPAPVAAAVAALTRELTVAPFRAPEAARLAALGLGRRELAAAERAGTLLRVTDGVVLPAGAERRAVAVLATIPQPFTLSQARQALGTTRRVAVPLLELLDRRGLTRRLPDDRRSVIEAPLKSF
ncbi:selenocysteine-specific translation elongation factor [Phytohabitans sp. ZYX-F-186]|uniref:Selenocysteine-specific translation elongation factor n=1 Tax=Phytohabitans maris TaxID=3071409 RepID=A0ABU0ZVV9_9ACTN|nr:selenocysteine-specific translation elongation factor [Phytohabitans sp. ZYX-F-186]MDQ7911164.1 selenocysteine-specific translation elongation factor [Phytohabitans sp. ZYX-F-186]